MTPCDVFFRRQVAATTWPDGPADLDQLFAWPGYNSDLLLNNPGYPDLAQFCTANAMRLMDVDIIVHDNYSGMGTGSYTMWLQHHHLKRD